ncbi:MAG: XTP/dITP diphosphatase [Clostridia bacterium]|nr:XTP/dITP diphosphatase [Clostridia bacterium]
MKLLIATGNAHKVREISEILLRDIGPGVEVLSLHDVGFEGEIVEDGTTFEENALIKARAGAATGHICMADDSGLSVDALGGAPGVYSARYAGEPADYERNNDKLLSELRGLPPEKRGARFVSAVALVFPGRQAEFTVRGECPGRILKERHGKGGFGYDPLFFYEPLSKTFAELSPEEKNRVSHRARSMEAFVTLLKQKMKEYGYTLC